MSAGLTSSTPSFGVFQKDALPERITAKLLSLIAEKQLRPGDRLPPERDLALAMGVSRPSLREALRALAIMNVLEIRQGSGTYIGSLRPDMLVEHLDFVFSLEDSTYLDLLRARKVMEAGIAAMAAENVTDEEIARLGLCVEESARNIGDPERVRQIDADLHRLITEAARNPFLSLFMTSISRLALASRGRTVALPGVEGAINDHRAIVEAIKARDPQAAAQAMQNHLDNVERRLLQQTGAL
jgi:GntR family transcriptional regulator, transcriptional repressor for pyruvate dehydrogenase complex